MPSGARVRFVLPLVGLVAILLPVLTGAAERSSAAVVLPGGGLRDVTTKTVGTAIRFNPSTTNPLGDPARRGDVDTSKGLQRSSTA